MYVLRSSRRQHTQQSPTMIVRDSSRGHPIQVVARSTGLSADVIRAWERRYGVVAPVRLPSGRRLYSDADIERLRLLARASLAGHNIGQIAGLDGRALAKLVNDLVGVTAAGEARESTERASVSVCLEAIEAFDVVALEAELRRAAVALSAEAFIDTLVEPLHSTVINSARTGVLHAAHEHVADAVLRGVLARIVDAATSPLAHPDLSVATPLGQPREFGALLVAATAAAEGWRPLNVGVGVSAEAIAEATVSTNARAVALNLGELTSDRAIARELRRLRTLVPTGVPILIEGAQDPKVGVLREIDAVVLRDAAALRSWIRTRDDQ